MASTGGSETGNKSDGSIPYIGSRISLISKKDIRYEGLLFDINATDATVALQNVRSFGTEDRVQGEGAIPAHVNVFDYVIFRGQDIKDLHVCEAPANVSTLPNDPAIISSKPPPVPPPQTTTAAAARPTSQSAHQVSEKSRSPSQSEKHQGSRRADKSKREPRDRNRSDTGRIGGRTIPGMGDHLLHRKERGTQDAKAPEDAKSKDFDFQASLGIFDKESEFSKLSLRENGNEEELTTVPQPYNKTSFFDDLSYNVRDKGATSTGQSRAAEERKLNTETFGAVGLNDRRGSYGRGRGKWRGRGRGRRGRGGGNNRGFERYNRGRNSHNQYRVPEDTQ